jgi:hypothetical protein
METENAKRWWTDATVAEAAGAWGAIEMFVDGRADDAQNSDRFTRALSLLLLLDEESQPLARLLNKVKETDDAKLALILPEPRERRAEMNALGLKLWAVVEGVEACGPLLPERMQKAVMETREALKDEYQRILGEYSAACIRRHFKRWSAGQGKSDS